MPEPSPMSSPGTHVLSREAEIARLTRFLGAGDPAACLVLLGEPGVGKTTLWEEGIALGGANGLAVRSARTSEAETALSFAALGDLLDGLDGEVLGALPAPHLRAIDVALRRADAGPQPADPLAICAGFLGALRLLAAPARRMFEQVAHEAEARGEGGAMAMLTIQRCELELRCGDLIAAEQLFEEMCRWVSLDDLTAIQGRLHALAAALRGDPADAAAWAGRVLEAGREALSTWDRLESHRVLGIVALFVQDAAEAVSQLAPIWEHTQRHHVRDPGAFPVAGDLVEALLLAGDAPAARDVGDLLRRDATEQQHPWGLATAKRCSALLQMHEGVEDEAWAVLEGAAAGYGALGLGFEHARCLLALGRAQRRSKRSGAARQSFEEAAGQFAKLGCVGWAEQARSELTRISGRRRQSSDDPLTPGERRVADLAAGGRSNKEIAAELFVSVYTVEEHLSHTYAKLGIRSRSQLARALESLE